MYHAKVVLPISLIAVAGSLAAHSPIFTRLPMAQKHQLIGQTWMGRKSNIVSPGNGKKYLADERGRSPALLRRLLASRARKRGLVYIALWIRIERFRS